MMLFTRQADTPSSVLLRQAGYDWQTAETLRIEYLPAEPLPACDYLVISSRNALPFLIDAGSFDLQKIFCVGEKTAVTLQTLFPGKPVSSFPDMKRLIASLSAEKPGIVLHLCGDHHRRELEEALKKTAFTLWKKTAYLSKQLFPKVATERFDTVFIFSPRSAESLFSQNRFRPDTLFSCIGTTSAAAVNEAGYDTILVAAFPSMEQLIKETILYKQHELTK